MIIQIEQKILERLVSKGLEAKGFEVKGDKGGISRPGIAVAIQDGEFERATINTYKQTVSVYIQIVFKNLKSDDARRKGVMPILQGVIDTLILQTLGLEIKPLVPVSFKNVTNEDDYRAGDIVFRLKFKTSFTVSKQDDEEKVDLITIGLNYYLQEPADDGVEDAADEVVL